MHFSDGDPTVVAAPIENTDIEMSASACRGVFSSRSHILCSNDPDPSLIVPPPIGRPVRIIITRMGAYRKERWVIIFERRCYVFWSHGLSPLKVYSLKYLSLSGGSPKVV